MGIKGFLNDVISRGGAKNVFVEVLEYLDDLPALQRKMESFFRGTELLLHLQRDNDVVDLFAGRITISQFTITRFLERILEGNKQIKCISVMVKDGYIICTLDIDKGPVRFQVSVKLGNIKVIFQREKREVTGDILEFPRVTPKNPLLGIICSAGISILRKIAGEEHIYRRVVKKMPGLAVKGNTLRLDLMRVPALEDVLSRKVLGIPVVEVFHIDRVELKNGKVRIYGGPRIPERLIH